MNKRLNILVANDDGIASPGLARLANAAARTFGWPRLPGSAAACPRR